MADKIASSPAIPLGTIRPIDPLTNALVRPNEVFRSLQVRDGTLRESAISNLVDRMRKYEEKMETDVGFRLAFQILLPAVYRISYECPFDDVREGFKAYLKHLEVDRGIVLPPPPQSSAFIPLETLPARDSKDPKACGVLENAYITYGRVSSLTHVLSFHPSYLDCILTTFNVVLHEEGPLPLTWRTFLSVMACSRHRCLYMLRRQQDIFLEHGGDIEWLRQGLSCPTLPAKLVVIAELNALLAHRPWLLTTAHIKSLVMGGELEGGISVAGWSLNELVHAIVILCTMHSLCSIIQATALIREPDNGIMTGTHPFRVGESAPDVEAASKPSVNTSAFAVDVSDVAAREELLRSRLLAPTRDYDAMSEIGVDAPAHISVGGRSGSSKNAALRTPKAAAVRRGSNPAAPIASALEVVEEHEDGGGGWDLGAAEDDDAIASEGSHGSDGEGSNDGGSASATEDGDGDDDDDGTGGYDDDEEFERAGAGPVFDLLPGFNSEASASGDAGAESIDADGDPYGKFMGKGALSHVHERDAEEMKRIEKKKQKDLKARKRKAKLTAERPTDEAESSGEDDPIPAPAPTPGGADISSLRYTDFNTFDGMFVTHEFSWEEHAYALLQRFYPAAAPVLDKEFRLTYTLTYHTFGSETSTFDTAVLRTAIWYYVQRLYGVRNDHYDYRDVNAFVPITTKGFCKKVACYPEIISERDFREFTTTFKPDEKVHVIMLAAEARRQASLLYGLRAIMQHMNG